MSLLYDGDDSSTENEPLDTIDLTNSSPEPPPRRFGVPHRGRAATVTQQTRLTNSVKVETRPSGPVRTAPAQEDLSRIDHVYRIIRTSSPDAIQTVLLNLCKISPALCGAVARGLTPHSSYAQSVLRRARNQPTSTPVDRLAGIKTEQRATTVKREPPIRIKRESGESSARPVPTASSTRRAPANQLYNVDDSSSEELLELPSFPKSVKKERATSPARAGRRTLELPSFPGSVKKERAPSPAHSEGSSSAAFSDVSPAKHERPPTTPLPRDQPTPARSIPNPVARSANASTSRTTDRTLDTLDGESEPSQRICKLCNKAINESTPDICYYHPGYRRRTLPGNGPGSLRYDCCQGGVLSRGCEIGRHNSSPRQTRPQGPLSSSPTLQRPSKTPRLR